MIRTSKKADIHIMDMDKAKEMREKKQSKDKETVNPRRIRSSKKLFTLVS